MEYHYVYRITNTIKKLHYYGARTSKDCLPRDDLGVKYFSSSTDKTFIFDQKNNPRDYKYKIIKILPTRKQALELEIKLHNKFNVDINESFFNKAKQPDACFNVLGNKKATTNRMITTNNGKNIYKDNLTYNEYYGAAAALSRSSYQHEINKKVSETKLKTPDCLKQARIKSAVSKMNEIMPSGLTKKQETVNKSKETKNNKTDIEKSLIQQKTKDTKFKKYLKKMINVFNSRGDLIHVMTKYDFKNSMLPLKLLATNSPNVLYSGISNATRGLLKAKGILKYKGWYTEEFIKE